MEFGGGGGGGSGSKRRDEKQGNVSLLQHKAAANEISERTRRLVLDEK